MTKEQEVASAERRTAEGGIASAESAVAEPEIEVNEGSVEESERAPNESAAAEDDSGEAGCPIEMGYKGPRCGRKLHVASGGVDSTPVCLMHTKDPNKQSGPLFDAFWMEFERILKEAGVNEAHFERFVFPQCFLTGRKFQAICRFDYSTFTKDVNFIGTTFTQDANFHRARFKQKAGFPSATFARDANFYKASFAQNAGFSCATFKRRANFYEAAFAQEADFSNAIFTQTADFFGATFTQDARFVRATFTLDANFNNAEFKQNAEFWDSTFALAAHFVETNFYGMASWSNSGFLDRAEFLGTKFEPEIAGEPSAIFAQARFSKPNEIVFDDVDLSRVLFLNCDVSGVFFTPSVRWGTRKGNRGLAVFEETIPLDHRYAKGLLRDGQRDYRAVAQIYQQLKKNYDSRLDYWTANEFHFGEMEMKRLAVPTDGRLLWLRQWWHRNLSFVAWYKYASDYGNSYRKPIAWLFGTLVLSAVLLPLPGVGLQRQGHRPTQTYASVWNLQKGYGENLWAEARLTGKSAITSVDTATFQRSAEYAPAYPWGRVLAIVETLLTSSLFALFLLAIRRQFRR